MRKGVNGGFWNMDFRGCNVAVREVTDPEYETSVKYSVLSGTIGTKCIPISYLLYIIWCLDVDKCRLY